MAYLDGLLQEDDFIHQTLGHFNTKYRALMKYAKHLVHNSASNHHLAEAVRTERIRARQQIVTDKPSTAPLALRRDELLSAGLDSDADLLLFGNLSLVLFDFYTAIGCYTSISSLHSDLPIGQQYLIAIAMTHFQSWKTIASLLAPIATELAGPYRSDAFFRIGIACKHLGIIDEARSGFQVVLTKPPPWLTAADVFVEMSHLEFMRGDLSTAISIIDSSPVQTPAVLQQHAFLALCCEEIGKMEYAIFILGEARATKHSADLTYLKGRLQYKRGRLTEAFDSLSAAMQLNDKNPLIWCALGNIYVRECQLSDAALCYIRAIQADDKMIEAWLNLAACIEIEESVSTAHRQLLDILPDPPVRVDLTRRTADMRTARASVPTIVEPNDRDRFPSAASLIDDIYLNEVPAALIDEEILGDLELLTERRQNELEAARLEEDRARQSLEDGQAQADLESETDGESSPESESENESSDQRSDGGEGA
jgi:tetratricopeptide (TPR) repeat protein